MRRFGSSTGPTASTASRGETHRSTQLVAGPNSSLPRPCQRRGTRWRGRAPGPAAVTAWTACVFRRRKETQGGGLNALGKPRGRQRAGPAGWPREKARRTCGRTWPGGAGQALLCPYALCTKVSESAAAAFLARPLCPVLHTHNGGNTSYWAGGASNASPWVPDEPCGDTERKVQATGRSFN